MRMILSRCGSRPRCRSGSRRVRKIINTPLAVLKPRTNAYFCSPANPLFIGWQPIYNAVNAILGRASAHGITVTEVDMQNESDFDDFTAYGRLIVARMEPIPSAQGTASGQAMSVTSVRWWRA